MNISLTPKLEALVREKVASGLYGNASEVMREALRLLIARDLVPATVLPTLPDKADVRRRILASKKALRDRGIKSLSLCGSRVRNEARSGSEIDLLFEAKSGATFSLADLVSLKEFLEQRLDRCVEVVMRESLDPVIRDRVLAEAERVF